MEYNTGRDKLIISEYGRNVQKLVNHAIAMEDREKRTKFAKMIVQIMGQLNPASRDTSDYMHKLWDHLYIISDFQLDVDSPYPPPSREILTAKPEMIQYRDNSIKYKVYGSNIEKIIKVAKTFEEGPEKEALIHTIANHLKKSYLNWNRDSVNDELIFEHLEKLSAGDLKLHDDLSLSTTNDILAKNKKKKVTKPERPGKGSYQKKKFKRKTY